MSLTTFFYEIKKTIKNFRLLGKFFQGKNQRWSRGHKARGQGKAQKKNPRPRTDPLEAKDRNARGQGHKRKYFPKKKVFKIFF